MAGPNLTGEKNTADYNLGRGTVYFANLSSSLPDTGGFRDLGNAPAFNLSIETEELEHFSSRSGLKAIDLKLALSRATNISFQLDEMNFENLAMFFSGEKATYTNPASGTDLGTSTRNLVHLSPQVGRWYDLIDSQGTGPTARIYDLDVSQLTLYDAVAAGSAYTITDDYLVDADLGRIFIPEGSTAVAPSDIYFEYTGTGGATEDPTIDEVRAGTLGQVQGALLFIAENAGDSDRKTEYMFHQVSLTADGDLSLIGDEVTVMSFAGAAEENTTASPDSPVLTIRYPFQA